MEARSAPGEDACSTAALTWRQGWRYGLMGLPLAFVALPLYVLLPNHYAKSFGLSLAALGAVLMGARLFDTLIDPLLGRWADRLHARMPAPQASRRSPALPAGAGRAEACVPHGPAACGPLPPDEGWGEGQSKCPGPTDAAPDRAALVLRRAAALALALCAGFALLLFPPAAAQDSHVELMLWLGVTLLLTTTAFSALTILHQAWGARLGGDAAFRSRVVAWREGLGLAGVIIASIAPLALGLPGTVALLLVASVAGWLAWRSGPAPGAGSQPSPLPRQEGAAKSAPDQRYNPPRPHPADAVAQDRSALWLPWRRGAFRRLLAVFMVNGIAGAIPATLMLFFVQDRLQAPARAEPLFLGSYFVCAALSMPLWLKLVPRLGLARTWGLGMLLAVVVFVFAAGLGAGDVTAFVIVCALSGVALGADLALPAALLAGVIQHNGDQQHSEGAYFGWWAFATKLNLALAAGLALPALGLLGYSPGATDPDALQTLTLAYCVLPCVLKTLAALMLYILIIRSTP